MLAPLPSPSNATAGEGRTTATADEVVRIGANLESGDYIWQSTTFEASNEGTLLPFHLGFVVALEDPINVISDDGVFSPLQPGQAIGVEEGGQFNLQSLDGAPVQYAAVELLPSAEAEDLTSPAFTLEGGEHELALQLFEPPPGNATEIRQLVQPILILVQTGSFNLESIDSSGAVIGEPQPLATGDSASLLFDSRLRQAGNAPTGFFVATLDAPGGESPSPSASPSTSASPSSSASTRPSSSSLPMPSIIQPHFSLRPAASTAASHSPSARPSTGGIFGSPLPPASPRPSAAGESPSRSVPPAKASPAQHAVVWP